MAVSAPDPLTTRKRKADYSETRKAVRQTIEHLRDLHHGPLRIISPTAFSIQDLTKTTRGNLSQCVSPGTMAGARRRFNYIGSVEMKEATDRNGDTEWSDPEFFNRWVTARRFRHSFLVEPEDAERTFTDPTSDQVKAAVAAGKRRKDRSIIEAFTGVAYTGENGETAVPFPDGQRLGIQLGSPTGAPANTGLNLKKLKAAKYLLDCADIDPDEPRFFAITAFQLQELLDMTETTSSDYNNVKALVEGDIDTFLGFTFKRR